ncbi:hypothetical protein V5799_005757, partial [Amblyomma americanum]
MKSNRGITGHGRASSSVRGKHSRGTRNMSSPDDTCTVPKFPPGPLAKLLPAGTTIRNPPGKLVQLVAQAISTKARGRCYVYSTCTRRC